MTNHYWHLSTLVEGCINTKCDRSLLRIPRGCYIEDYHIRGVYGKKERRYMVHLLVVSFEDIGISFYE